MMILTSSVASVATHMHKHFLAAENYKKVLFIDTAAEPEIGLEPGDDSWLIDDLNSLQDISYQVDRFTITGKSKEEIEQTFSTYDVLYMCGGDTKYLVEKMHESNVFDLIRDLVKEGKPYIGTSAGSIVTGPRLPDYFHEDGDENMKCLGLVDFTLVPHWGSPDFEDQYKNGKRLDQVYNINQDPLLLLTDSQYVFVDNEWKLQIIDSKQ